MAQQRDVPGYTEVKALGSGGFGDVVLARHDASGTRVAIKYLRWELLADPQFAELFRAEAAVLASLADPNVVRLYEYVESPGGAAIVMELVEGVSLREILSRQGATTPEAALVVLQGSLLGLAAAHRRGVVHRDYKPENVLIDGAGVSKLTDFGIAARAGQAAMAAGTLAYAPPEQFAGGMASPAADVYAATATFYECLTGHPPFTGRTAEMLMRQHMAEPVPMEPVPEALRPLVEAGMAKDPARRPADGAALVARLRTAAGQAYGPDWEERGRSGLAEAALLLAALWPSSGPAAVQASTVHKISLRRHLPHLHISMVKAAIMAGIVIAGAAAGTAVAATVSRPSSSPAAATPAPSATATSGAHDYNNLAQLDQAISEWVVQSKHTGLLQEANCQESAANQYTCDVLYSIPAGAEHVAVVAVTPNGGSFTVVSYSSFASAPSPTTAAPSPTAPGGHDYNNLSQLDAAVAASISASSGLAVTSASCVVWPTLAYNYTCTIYYQKAGTEVFHVVVTPNGSSFSIVSGG